MTNADHDEFALALAALAACFRVELDEIACEGYWQALDDLELATVKAACRQLSRKAKYMPHASEIRGLVLEAKEQMKRDMERATRMENFRQAIVYGIAQEAVKKGWSEDQFHCEIQRVARNMNHMALPLVPLEYYLEQESSRAVS